MPFLPQSHPTPDPLRRTAGILFLGESALTAMCALFFAILSAGAFDIVSTANTRLYLLLSIVATIALVVLGSMLTRGKASAILPGLVLEALLLLATVISFVSDPGALNALTVLITGGTFGLLSVCWQRMPEVAAATAGSTATASPPSTSAATTPTHMATTTVDASMSATAPTSSDGNAHAPHSEIQKVPPPIAPLGTRSHPPRAPKPGTHSHPTPRGGAATSEHRKPRPQGTSTSDTNTLPMDVTTPEADAHKEDTTSESKPPAPPKSPKPRRSQSHKHATDTNPEADQTPPASQD